MDTDRWTGRWIDNDICKVAIMTEKSCFTNGKTLVDVYIHVITPTYQSEV